MQNSRFYLQLIKVCVCLWLINFFMSHQISNRRKRLIDKAARWVVTTGGAAIIVWLAAIFVFIFIEVYPLFGKPETGEIHSFKVDEIITPLNPPLEKGGEGGFSSCCNWDG